MQPIFKKLNYAGQDEIFVLNAPPSFRSVMDGMADITNVKTTVSGAKAASFLLVFVTRQTEVDQLARQAARLMTGDGTLWFAYPKGTSRKYTCEFNRDTGWAVPGQLGFEPVRQVAIDEDWSALRFRRVEYIKTLRRAPHRALTEKGGARTARR